MDSANFENCKNNVSSRCTIRSRMSKQYTQGLECGIIGEKYPGMDMISFGPTLEGVHSPDEKIHIDTVEKFWNFLLAILKNVK
jgi:di/tripeptidase